MFENTSDNFWWHPRTRRGRKFLQACRKSSCLCKHAALSFQWIFFIALLELNDNIHCLDLENEFFTWSKWNKFDILYKQSTLIGSSNVFFGIIVDLNRVCSPWNEKCDELNILKKALPVVLPHCQKSYWCTNMKY